MEVLFRYLIIASVSTAILYLVYFLILRKENNFKLSRIYLVSGLIFSLLLPLNRYNIELSILSPNHEISEMIGDQTYSNSQVIDYEPKHLISTKQNFKLNEEPAQSTSNIRSFFIVGYFIVSFILTFRILFSVFQITWYYLVSKKKKQQGFTIVYIKKKSIPFSFLRLIFINQNEVNENLNQIIEHEKIHAKQLHTIDLLITEFLVAIMWFNPFIWMYKRELQQVHEFLADEGVLNSGVDQLEYQSLLVNHAAEGRLVAVSSNFSYSLIKKRIKMMSKMKSHGSGKKILLIAPVIVTLIFSVSIINQTINANPKIEYNTLGLKMKPLSATIHNVKGNNFALDKKKKQVVTDIEKDKVNEKAIEKLNEVNPFTETSKELTPEDTTPTLLVAAVSPTKMNVLYVGLDNPVAIGVTGANMEDVEVTIDSGTIIGSKGNYIVRVNGFRKIATITVKAKNNVVAKKMFRVKKVPDPIAMIGNTRGGSYSKDVLLNAKGVDAVLPNFDFDLKFEIVSFNVSAMAMGGYVEDSKQYNGSAFTKEQLRIISETQPGRKIYIEDIKARGPDGTIRDLGSLTYRIIE